MEIGLRGAKRSIFLALAVYTGIGVLGYLMSRTWHFYVLAPLVATVQGGCQGLLRSLFASMIPAHKSAEFFGFFGVVEKFAGIFGPLLFALAITVTGSTRAAILSVIAFFVLGAGVLAMVNVEEGRRAAGIAA